MFFTTVMYLLLSFFFFFNDTATTEIYTLSLHDALPILTAHDAFDRQRFCFAHNHRAPGQLITERLQIFRELVKVGGDKMIVDLMEAIEPKRRKLIQDRALVWDRIG